MYDDRRTTDTDTDTDRKTVLAGRRLADALRGGGADQVMVVLPGDEPLEFRVFVCRDAEEAVACLQRHGWGRRDRDLLAEYGRRIREEFLRAGSAPVRVVLPGDEPLEFRVFVCRDAEAAAACLQRHGWGRTPGTR